MQSEDFYPSYSPCQVPRETGYSPCVPLTNHTGLTLFPVHFCCRSLLILTLDKDVYVVSISWYYYRGAVSQLRQTQAFQPSPEPTQERFDGHAVELAWDGASLPDPSFDWYRSAQPSPTFTTQHVSLYNNFTQDRKCPPDTKSLQCGKQEWTIDTIKCFFLVNGINANINIICCTQIKNVSLKTNCPALTYLVHNTIGQHQ